MTRISTDIWFSGFGDSPLRLVTFLNLDNGRDSASEDSELEFDGDPETGKGGPEHSGWRWRHRIIQEYFLNNKS